MFDIRIINLNAGSYLRIKPKEDLVKTDTDKKNLHLQACLGCRRSFTLMVYSADGIPRTEAILAQKCLALNISQIVHRDEMLGPHRWYHTGIKNQ